MQNKWMAREEFERLYEGHCWIAYSDRDVTLAFFYNGNYYESADNGASYYTQHIKAVMPIEKPEYPKEVG